MCSKRTQWKNAFIWTLGMTWKSPTKCITQCYFPVGPSDDTAPPSHTQQKASLSLHYRTCASNVFLRLSPIDKFTSTWSLSWERCMCHCPQMLHSFSSRIFHTTISNLSKSLLKTNPIVTAALILHHTFQHPLMTAQSGRSKCPGAVLQIKKFHKIVWIFFFWFLS